MPDDGVSSVLRSVTEWLNDSSCTPPISEPLTAIENCQSRFVNADIQGGQLSKKRKRAPSPMSTMSDPIMRSPPKSSSSTTSSRSRSPVKRIRKAAVNIPKEMREDLERHPVARRNLNQVTWQEDHRHSLSEIRDFWIKVQSIEEAATICSKEGRSEDSWSDDVVLEIIRLALSWSGLRNKVMLANLKSVGVDQPALLPMRNLHRVVPNKIDYGLRLQPDAEEEVMIENVLRNMSDELPSISQSAVPMLRKRALFYNLEIKKPYGNKDPVPQLGVWSIAGLTKLSNLARESHKKIGETTMLEDPEVPVLPSWSVEGHRWQFYLGRRCSSAETVIQGPFWNYDTSSVVEIIFIVNTLCEIHRWGNTTFRKWLLTVISGLQTD
ncbi:hypothetical protein Z517_11943 [Fonsecaea pedrosoi CBS 271.37]|uniref:PD-(D/E)XK nuclease-like domain-containing protein n=1 Tax=Fonsecaea pedrosoi CBS 271.37 TaxID=1442368 RepID=A0A0D2DC41_9EURO|nr:uncharacterized protein Z517_11943 [Fonsecaea pedrosoi CBS 271.37]KIW75171.1 hypothetical protein Z517_11943 [Fonsecaea pedrosoi CBS 271.37]